jgi:hypothetical protein
LGLDVFEIAVGAWLIAVIVITGLVGVYDNLPVPVEARRVTTFDIGNQRGLLSLDGCDKNEKRCQKRTGFYLHDYYLPLGSFFNTTFVVVLVKDVGVSLIKAMRQRLECPFFRT